MNSVQLKQSKTKKIELVLQQINTLPTLPSIAARLLHITVKSDTQAKEVVALIESDPSLAGKIISLATSASTGINRHSASLSKAVVLLGFDTVRNAVLSIKVFESFGNAADQGNQEEFDRVGFWKHSLATACASRMLIKHIDNTIDPEEAFVAGLLHDIGKLALVTALPKSYNRVVQLTESSMGNISQAEQSVLGLDHTVAGKRLAEKWQLPDDISQAIWLHHQWAHGLPDTIKNRSLIQTVHLADLIARELRIGYSGNHVFAETPAQVAQELGCPQAILEEISRQLCESISERAAMLGLEEMVPEDIYYKALGNANDELGQLNLKLQRQNKKLQVRSGYFQLLDKLTRSINTRQTVVDVCNIVTEIWQQHTQCPRCAVYVTDKEDFIIEGVVALEPDKESTTFLVDRSEDPDIEMTALSRNQISDHPVGFSISPVGQNHYWFFEQVAPMFEIGSCLTMPLYAGNEQIGDILWQADNHNDYKSQLEEMQAFASCVALALRQTQIQQQLGRFCEQMAQSNETLQKAQRELQQKRNLATVGEMASGAAHEINNPLAVIVGRAQLLAGAEQDPDKKKTLENIAHQGRQITDIITELMEFAVPALPKPASQPVTRLLQMAAEIYQPAAQQKNIRVLAMCQDDLPDVFVDAEQMGSAIAALVVNAIESYDDIEKPEAPDQPDTQPVVNIEVRYDELESDIIIDIKDKGCGMDQETLSKATDPFFSAKKAGRQRGLGLSRSLRQIKNNAGQLRLTSQAGKATIARVSLPVSQTGPDEQYGSPE